jgi:hypothetical protein
MRRTNDLIAQTRITSGDIMRVMGGVVFGVGLIGLAVAIAIGLDRKQIEPFRVMMTCSTLAVVLGGIVWITASFSRRLEQLEARVGLEAPSLNGDGNISSIDRARF